MPGEAPPNRDDFVLIRAANPGPMTLTGTNTYVVGRDPCRVIDPGPDDEAHIEAVRAEADSRGGIDGVLLTHSHADHSAGVERLGAPLLFGAVSDADEITWQPDPGEEAATAAPPEFEVMPTPGHAADHCCFVWRDTCFCGDIILGEGSTIVPPDSFGGSVADYLASLERLRDVTASLFAPGHGPWVTDPQAKIADYVAHRLERERKLVAALDSGERSREALLDAAWADVAEPMRPAAAMAMQAHLEKLEGEGRVDTASLTG